MAEHLQLQEVTAQCWSPSAVHFPALANAGICIIHSPASDACMSSFIIVMAVAVFLFLLRDAAHEQHSAHLLLVLGSALG